MLKLQHNCTYLTCQQSNAQNSPSQASIVHELRTSICLSQIQKGREKKRKEKAEETKIKLLTCIGTWKNQDNSIKTSTALLTIPKPWAVWITTNWKILKDTGIPDCLTCLLRNLYAGQEATVRIRHETTDWFKIGKGV